MTGKSGFLRAALLGTVGGVAMLAASGPSQAAGIAFAALEINDFAIYKGSTGTQYAITDFTAINILNSGSNKAQLDAGLSAPSGVSGNNGVDVVQAAVGAGFPGQNTFTQQAGGHFARADMRLLGQIITPPPGASATANTVSELRLTSSATGGQNLGSVGTSTGFTLAASDSIVFDFDAIAKLVVGITGAGETGVMRAANSFTITISSGATTVFSWTPNGQSGGISAGATEHQDGDGNDATTTDALTQSISYAVPPEAIGELAVDLGELHYRAETPILNAGQSYTLSITHNSTTEGVMDVPRIPEPATIGLLGLGLAAIGLGRRRRHR